MEGTDRGRRIGLLGGSFDPAHGGHLALSREALKRLDLDEIWWLVSPQNPLKPRGSSIDARVGQARRVAAAERRIKVGALEVALGTRYTVDTLRALRRWWPRTRFVWLMGADNLAQINRWHGWTTIFRLVPVAVFARPSYSLKALASVAAHRFAKRRQVGRNTRYLADMPAPVWTYFSSRLDPISSSRLRSQQKRESASART